ncbi:MAG: hypothetical protein WC141_08890 [Arcobacteraceae bacterium]
MEKEINNQKPSNVLHYIAYTLLIAVVLVMAYLVFMPEKTLLEFEKKAVPVSFEDLPYSTQLKYKTNEEYKKIESKLNAALEEKQSFLDEIASFQEQAVANELAKNKVEETAIEVKKEAEKSKPTVPLIVKEEPKKAQQPTLMQSSQTAEAGTTPAKRIKEFAKCYDMDVGKYNITQACKKNIIAFIDKHKNASYFEIIGIIDETEFTLFKNLENNNFIYEKLKVTQHSIDTMKKLSQSGLAKHRAIEGNWVIKSHMGIKANVYNANYNLLSNDGKKGFVIRAYE